MTDKIYLTNEGFLEIEEELNELKEVKRPEIIKALKDARSLGDLSENADYDAARNEQAQIESRILELEKILETAEIIENRDTDKVGIGATVRIQYIEDEDVEEYRIVGSKEADPSNDKISNESPLAQAILNARVGDVCMVESPNGKYFYFVYSFVRARWYKIPGAVIAEKATRTWEELAPYTVRYLKGL